MPPLRRIFSISAADLQTIAMIELTILTWFPSILSRLAAGRPGAIALDYLKYLGCNLLYRQVSINRHQPSLARVVFGYWLGLQFIGRQSIPDDFFTVIFAGHQRRTVNIASISDLGWLGVDVVDSSTDG